MKNRALFNILLLIFLLALIAFHTINATRYINTKLILSDFSQDYFASFNLLNNESIYNIKNTNNFLNYVKNHDIKKPISEIVNNYHPPLVAVFYTPFSYFFSYSQSVIILTFIIILSLITCIYYLCTQYPLNKNIILAICFSSMPFSLLIKLMNIDWLIFVLISSIFYLETNRNGKSKKSSLLIGFLLALATQIKVYPLILLFYFIIKKEKSVILSFILSSFLLLTLTIYFVGIDDISLYYTKISQNDLKTYANAVGNLSVLHLIILLFNFNGYIKSLSLFNIPSLAYPTYFLTIGLFTLLNAFLSHKLNLISVRNKKNFNDISLSLWITSMLICSPIIWGYGLCVLIIPVLVLLYYKKISNYYLFFPLIIIYTIYILDQKQNNVIVMLLQITAPISIYFCLVNTAKKILLEHYKKIKHIKS